MRVLAVSNLYPPQALGGYEYSCRDVLQRWRARGHDAHVLTTETRLVTADDEPGIEVRRTLRWYWHDHRLLRPPLRQRLAVERHNRATLEAAIDDLRPDVVSVWAMGAMSLGLVDVLNDRDVPTVYVICDEWPVYGPRLDAWTAPFLTRRSLGRAVAATTRVPTAMAEPRDATYCWVSAYVRAAALTATGWQPAHETVTYSGIDTEDFPVAPPVARPWRGRLVCAGRIEPRKGFRTVIEALPRLPADLTLTVVGPDQAGHTDDLRALARELGVAGRVTFTCVPRDRMREVYADADAVVFPSAWQEPFGLVPVEAMACGVPVVAAPTGGAREFLADGLNCLAVPPGDPSAIVAAVERLAAEPTLRAALTAAGARTAADLTVDRLTDVLEQWHVAASLRYRDGEPPPRPPVSPCAPTPT